MLEKNLYTLPTKAGECRRLGKLINKVAQAKECADITERHHGLVLIITSDIQSSIRLQKEIKQFTNLPVTYFADWETLPYDRFSPHQDIIAARLSLLYKLPNMNYGILIISVNTLMQRVCPYSFLYKYSLIIQNKQKISQDILCKQLEQNGYHQVHQVMEYGEYAIQGACIVLYPMGSAHPYRIDFFDDLINNIHIYNIDNQRTLKTINNIKLLPVHEFPTDKTAIELFSNRWREFFEITHDPASIYSQVNQGILPPGIEYWQPLFFQQELPTLFNYLPTNTLFISNSDLQITSELFWENINKCFKNKNIDTMRPLLKPTVFWLHPEFLKKKLKSWPLITLSNEILPNSAINTNLSYQQLPNLNTQNKTSSSVNLLSRFIKQFKGRIIFSIESEGRQENLQETLNLLKVYPKKITYFKQYLQQTYSIMVGPSEYGFIDIHHQLSFICERDIHKRNISSRFSQENKSTKNQDVLIHNFADLYPGKPVVHLDHGIGRYIGLTTLEVNSNKAEYLMISYADNTMLYVPVSSLYLINSYIGTSDENAPLHKLGTDNWLRIRKKTEKKVHDIVVELLDIYAHRKAETGFSFKYHHEKYHLFCMNFPFKTTPDQEQAINAVLNDMCKPIVMDRLICGDVGFGKTEVAMRAAFIAVENGKQVAVLVPTTLLAQQHYNTFRDRFANWPIRIDMLSRFRSAKEQNQVIKKVSLGKIDILISTHKLLMGNLQWHNLGLLIIDEEHRFGVKHKESIKAIHKNIDILTLTATPIPRTLNMAMIGMLDLSIISTPPARRLAVKTFVREYDVSIVREAILREILRGGQIYYLYNDVKNIEKTAKRLKKLIPEAHIIVGHAQMPERELEKVMHDFYHCRFNVLVCTTIVETGIDVPNANTIIIERADKFGLAQLHQLRGRVGRSHRQAYAWLLTSHVETMTIDAQKRLEAISSLEKLGAGFDLATHDLEIRGAGEILGKEQSGQIETIGFPLYMEMLQTAVTTIKNGQEVSLQELIKNQTEIDIHTPALLPEKFIPDVNTRLSFYKRIANALNEEELTECKLEMIDRFGNLPKLAAHFLEIASLRLAAHEMGICKIEINNQGGFFEFRSQNYINFNLLMNIIQKNTKQWKLDGPMRLRFNIDFANEKNRVEWLKNFLTQLKNVI